MGKRSRRTKRSPGAAFSTVSLARAFNWPRGGTKGQWWKQLAAHVRNYPQGSQRSWGIPFRMARGAGCRVILFVRYGGEAYWQDIERVGLIDGHETVACYPEARRFPVDEEGWIKPRSKPGFQGSVVMSGTPYREIDLSTMNRLEM